MGDIGKLNRDAFYWDQTLDGEDASSKLRVMFAINQYNEGVHAPNVDGVILGRETKSDIVFFEEIGRALSVKGDIRKLYEEYDKYSKEKLISLAHKKGFTNVSNIDKAEIIEKLLAPVIIDLSGNISFIIDLESRLNDRLMQIKKQGKSSKRQIKLKNASFDIDVATLDLFNLLQYLKNRLAPKSWDEWYDLACKYYEHHKNLLVPCQFKTKNGYDYDENGYSLGTWIYNQRKKFYTKSLSSEQIDKPKSIGMKFEARKKSDLTWNEWYKLAVKYYEYHHNLQIPIKYKTINGFEYNEDGEKLGVWLKNQKKFYTNDKISQEHIDLLNNIQNENQLKELLIEYDIDYDMNKKFIKTIPYQIFKSKLYYLIDNNNPILIDNRFHGLIFMSDIDMQKKYNISLKELIEKYSQTDKYNNQKK